MPARELVVLGSASQVPTRRRNHNGYFVRWDTEGFLFDPGEGTQRQMLLAGIPVSAVTRICLTHFHGDHCLGLPGVLQRIALDRVRRPVTVAYPRPGAAFYERLRYAAAFDDGWLDVRTVAVDPTGDEAVPVTLDPPGRPLLFTARLRHRVPAVGWRVGEPAGRTMRPEALVAAGVRGADVGRLQREGALDVGGRTVGLEDVSVARPPQQVAVVMDTAWCGGALALAAGVDLLVCEATFADADAALAEPSGHLTARQAGALAREAGVGTLVLAHFSQRYPDVGALVAQAAAEFDGPVIAAEDLGHVGLPPRRPAPA